MSNPLVSVIIPTYNGAAWLGDCLDSVIRQTYEPIEIIVVNDGSTDATAEVLARYGERLTVLRQQRGGIGAVRNRAVAAARGTYLAFLDHDDLWYEEKLARQMAYIRAHPETDILYTDAREFGPHGTIHESFFDQFPALRSEDNRFMSLVKFNVPLMSTILLRQQFFAHHLIRFPSAASGVDDLGLLLEAAARGARFSFLDEKLVDRRLHGGNLSKSHFNRFDKRRVLYGEMHERLQGIESEYRKALHWGLRHAHYSLGEWHWERFERQLAASHFQAARGWGRLGLQAAVYAALTTLPVLMLRGLRATKNWIRPLSHVSAKRG